MDQPTANHPARPYPTLPDGKYKYTAWDGSPRHFEPMHLPEIGRDFPIPRSVTRRLRSLFKRPAASH